MNRWALLFAAATLVVVGCAGDGAGTGGGGGGGGGTPLSSVNQAIFNKPGRVDVTYDTGQGRAPGSLTAVIRRLSFQDQIGLVETQLRSPVKLVLDGYTSQSIEVNPSMGGFSLPVLSRIFTGFPIEIHSIEVEQSDGTMIPYFGSGGAPIFLQSFPTRLRAFPGRISTLQIFLDDAAITFDEGLQVVTFDQAHFEAVNFHPIDNRINGFISDYLAFDITNVANQPQLTNGSFATRVYFSGDAFAISEDPVSGGAPMDVLTPSAPPIEALVSPPISFPIQAPGTYTMRQVDPTDLSGLARITSLQGIWRPAFDPDPAKSLILNAGTFECLLLPHGDDDDRQDMLFIERNLAGDIVDMYFGEADFTAGTFAAWPIENIDDGSAANEIDGILSGIVFRSDVPAGSPSITTRWVREGTFTFTSGAVPATWPAAGRFLVVRL